MNTGRSVKGWICAFAKCLSALLLFPTANTLAQSYMGKYCWNVTITNTTVEGLRIPTTFVLTTDIASTGGSSFAVAGYVTNPGDNPAILGGVGHRIGSKIYLSLAGSQNHLSPMTWRDTSVMHAEIDASSLSGTFYDVGNDFDTGQRIFKPRYSSGSIALASACP